MTPFYRGLFFGTLLGFLIAADEGWSPWVLLVAVVAALGVVLGWATADVLGERARRWAHREKKA